MVLVTFLSGLPSHASDDWDPERAAVAIRYSNTPALQRLTLYMNVINLVFTPENHSP